MAYTTTAEIKAVIGITGSDQDALIARMNTAMESRFDDLVGINTLDYATYTDEVLIGSGKYWISVRNTPLIALTALSDYENDTAITGWTVRRYDGRTAYLDGIHTDLNQTYLGTYTAGYRRAISDTIDNDAAVDNGDGTVGIPITGHTYLADDEITISDTTNYDGTYTIVSVDTDVVNITATYNAETFGGTETVVSTDTLPEEVKICIAYMVSGAMSDKVKNAGIKEYSILGKSVTFEDDAQYGFSTDVINKFAGSFQRRIIRGI